VLALSSGGGAAPTRLVLAGSAVSLALFSLTTALLLLFSPETVGLFAWGSGNLAQIGLAAVTQTGPLVLLGVLALLVLGRRLDVLGLGDDTAAVLGVAVRPTRLLVVAIAVLLSAAAVTVAGPVGFVGLGAPAIVRIVASRVPGMHRHRVLVPMAALAGVLVVLTADVLVRALLGGQGGVEVPTGVVTTVFGAGRARGAGAAVSASPGPVRSAPSARASRLRGAGRVPGRRRRAGGARRGHRGGRAAARGREAAAGRRRQLGGRAGRADHDVRAGHARAAGARGPVRRGGAGRRGHRGAGRVPQPAGRAGPARCQRRGRAGGRRGDHGGADAGHLGPSPAPPRPGRCSPPRWCSGWPRGAGSPRTASC
jgi:hypothetical protein